MIKQILKQAVKDGLVLHVSWEGETDYQGTNPKEAIDALKACDIMELRLLDEGRTVGWALYVDEIDEDEQIADYSGIVADYIEGIEGK